jgi:sugar phosphate isomerase/epimerase
MEKLGVQIYGLKEEFKSDLHGTLQSLHKMGFSILEPIVVFNEKQGKMPMNVWAEDTFMTAQKEMIELGMDIVSIHAGIGTGNLTMPAKVAAKKILNFHERTGVCNYVVSGVFDKASGAKKWAVLLKKIVEIVDEKGCTMIYHNHDTEFKKIKVKGEEIIALDYFFQLTSPKVMLQLDIGWAGFGTGDEIAVAKKYADRIISLHLKDFYPGIKNVSQKRSDIQPKLFAPIGAGCIKTAEILKMTNAFKNFNGSIIIDQDVSAGNMLEELQIGYDNIQKVLSEN